MIGLAIDSMGAADDACVNDGLVSEGGRAMRLSISDMDGTDRWGIVTKRDRYAPKNHFGNTGRGWWLVWEVTVTETGE